MKYLLALIASASFISALLLIYFLHVSYLSVNVVFYSAMYDAVIAAGLIGVVVFVLPILRNGLSTFERILLVIIWLLGGYAFAISVPTVVDRSLSMYILEKIQQRGGGIREEAMPEVFTQEYLPEHRLVDVRLTEQLESGTIEIVDGCVKLTNKGHRIANTSRWFRQNLLPKKRLLMGKYSDDLTDPFRKSIERTDYQCQ